MYIYIYAIKKLTHRIVAANARFRKSGVFKIFKDWQQMSGTVPQMQQYQILLSLYILKKKHISMLGFQLWTRPGLVL